MAKPRVLVSSTCRDLYLIREQLKKFIEDFGYEPVLSEYGDIYYSPDIHTHLSCIREVQNCDMIILIIGKSFGTTFLNDNQKSVTQYEHDTGFNNNIPMFTFISNDVYQDYYTYKGIAEKYEDEEKRKELLTSIPFSSNVDIRVFGFIDSVNNQIRNNACFGFSNFSDIEITLKKQWAGMVFDFLQQRKNQNNNDELYKVLEKIEIASSKIEKVTELLAEDSPKSKNDELQKITKKTEEQRLFLALVEIWNCFSLNKDYNIDELTDSETRQIINFLLTKPSKDDKTTFLFQKYLREIHIANEKSWYLNYLIDNYLLTMQTIYERMKFTKETLMTLIKPSLSRVIKDK